jgi:hypothetical protein
MGLYDFSLYDLICRNAGVTVIGRPGSKPIAAQLSLSDNSNPRWINWPPV